jgi:hypothetical protein
LLEAGIESDVHPLIALDSAVTKTEGSLVVSRSPSFVWISGVEASADTIGVVRGARMRKTTSQTRKSMGKD